MGTIYVGSGLGSAWKNSVSYPSSTDLAHLHTADFYVDGVLALHETDVVDTAVNRVVLGLGWSGNPSQTGYVDDITVQAVPEPSVLALALAGIPAAALFRRATSARAHRSEA